MADDAPAPFPEHPICPRCEGRLDEHEEDGQRIYSCPSCDVTWHPDELLLDDEDP